MQRVRLISSLDAACHHPLKNPWANLCALRSFRFSFHMKLDYFRGHSIGVCPIFYWPRFYANLKFIYLFFFLNQHKMWQIKILINPYAMTSKIIHSNNLLCEIKIGTKVRPRIFRGCWHTAPREEMSLTGFILPT